MNLEKCTGHSPLLSSSDSPRWDNVNWQYTKKIKRATLNLPKSKNNLRVVWTPFSLSDLLNPGPAIIGPYNDQITGPPRYTSPNTMDL